MEKRLKRSQYQDSHRGISLIEMSIVLAIIALLVGGVLGGQEIIHGASLRSIASDHQRFQAAIATFRTQYGSFPGDFSKAEDYWGKDDSGTNNHCRFDAVFTGNPGTCRGDNNGWIDTWRPEWWRAPYMETYTLWQHMALAKILEGNYLGRVDNMWGDGDSVRTLPPVIGVSNPAGKMPNTYWAAGKLSQNDPAYSEISYTDLQNVSYNWLILSGYRNDSWIGGAALAPFEAWSVDVKMDDGAPGTGIVRASPNAPNCATTAISSTAVYAATLKTKTCLMLAFKFQGT